MLASSSHCFDNNFSGFGDLDTCLFVHHSLKLVENLSNTHDLNAIGLVQILCLLDTALARDVAAKTVELILVGQC